MGDRGMRCVGVESTNYWVEEELAQGHILQHGGHK